VRQPEDILLRDLVEISARIKRLEKKFRQLEEAVKPLLKAKGLITALIVALMLTLKPTIACSQPGPGIVGVGIIPQGYQSPLQTALYSLYYVIPYYCYNASFGYLASLFIMKGGNQSITLQYYTPTDGVKTVTLSIGDWETLSFATVYLQQVNSDYCNLEFHTISQIIILPFLIPQQSVKQVTVIQGGNVNQSQIVQAVLSQLDLSQYVTREELQNLDHGSISEQRIREIAQAEAQRLYPNWKSEIETEILETVQQMVEEQTSQQNLLNNPLLQEADPKLVVMVQLLTAKTPEQQQQALAQYLILQKQQAARRNMYIAIILVIVVAAIIGGILLWRRAEGRRPARL